MAGESWPVAAQPALPADLADIAEALRRSRQSRDRHRDELQAVLDHANVGLALTRDARIDIVNRQFCADLGYQREQVVGQSPRLVYASDEAYEAYEACRLAAQAPFCLLYIDLDRFKQVNDTGGHAAGDALLRGLAA